MQTNDISDLQLTNIKTTALIYKDKYLPILKGDLKINVSIIVFSSILKETMIKDCASIVS